MKKKKKKTHVALSHLSSLILSGNKFYGAVPSSIGDLRTLKFLNMSNCGFSGRIPASIGNLLSLTTLDLSHQKFSGEVPIELSSLRNLQFISLEQNMLSGDVPEGFSSLSSLRYLNLKSNALSGKILATYGFQQRVIGTVFIDNRVSRTRFQPNRAWSNPEEISQCTMLTSLLLNENRLSETLKIAFTEKSLSSNSQVDILSSKAATIELAAHNFESLPGQKFISSFHKFIHHGRPSSTGSMTFISTTNTTRASHFER
ncbi:hypothetical protein IFM89_030551 [Coptis chinensis]|uniref:Disease resistance R13L4/SHOC-2-like LRR domain-containing protein n=1 Tax=Coptis chinensis TaxID=261450 RepID=A0A835LNX7_9MAGN|nr:hypothetical protein IFM89_030551 [Coptis chinensis]